MTVRGDHTANTADLTLLQGRVGTGDSLDDLVAIMTIEALEADLGTVVYNPFYYTLDAGNFLWAVSTELNSLMAVHTTMTLKRFLDPIYTGFTDGIQTADGVTV